MAGKRLKHVTDDGGEILRRLSPVIFRFVPADVTEVGVRLTVTPENGDSYVVEGEGRVNRSAGYDATEDDACRALAGAMGVLLPPGTSVRVHYELLMGVPNGLGYVAEGRWT